MLRQYIAVSYVYFYYLVIKTLAYAGGTLVKLMEVIIYN